MSNWSSKIEEVCFCLGDVAFKCRICKRNYITKMADYCDMLGFVGPDNSDLRVIWILHFGCLGHKT